MQEILGRKSPRSAKLLRKTQEPRQSESAQCEMFIRNVEYYDYYDYYGDYYYYYYDDYYHDYDYYYEYY